MADAARRQRQLAAKTAKRKAMLAGKKSLETYSTSLVGQVRVAAKGRIVECMAASDIFESGMGQVVVARALPSGLLGCAFFLLDTFCLGVKNVFYKELGRSELRSYLDARSDVQTMVDVEPAYARKLIRDSAAYAAGLGLPAEKDTPVVEAIFGDVDESACTETFTFGRDGKPFYMSGPNDTPARIRTIMEALGRSQGSGGWEYMIEAQPDV